MVTPFESIALWTVTIHSGGTPWIPLKAPQIDPSMPPMQSVSRPRFVAPINPSRTSPLVIQNSASTAGQWYVGDSDPECTGGAVQVGNDLNVTKNKNQVDVSENGTNAASSNGGLAGGIAHDLNVTGNAAGFVVEGNIVGHDANCNPGPGVTDGDSAPNTAAHNNNGCTN